LSEAKIVQISMEEKLSQIEVEWKENEEQFKKDKLDTEQELET